MKHLLTANDVANSVRMNRSLHKGTIMLVEGPVDSRVYGRFIDRSRCMVIPAFSRDNAERALAILAASRVPGVLAVVDRDFSGLDGSKSSSDNLLMTDTHDLETMILASDALTSVLSEFASRFGAVPDAQEIREVLLNNGMVIGLLRWISSPSKEGLNLTFDELPFQPFTNQETLQVDIDALIATVMGNSYPVRVDSPVLKSKLVSLMKEANAAKYDRWHICCGHDLVTLLFIGLTNLFGAQSAKVLTPGQLENVLRLRYTLSHFVLTDLHKSMLDWEAANTAFAILSRAS